MNIPSPEVIAVSLFFICLIVFVGAMIGIFVSVSPSRTIEPKHEELKRMDRRTSVVISSTKDRVLLFSTGFVQVAFVGANSYLVAKYVPLGIFLTSFAISIVWTFNVRRIVFGGGLDRFLYAFGAACGAVTGSSIAFYLVK